MGGAERLRNRLWKSLGLALLIIAGCNGGQPGETVPLSASPSPVQSQASSLAAVDVDPLRPLEALGLSRASGLVVALTHNQTKARFSGTKDARLEPLIDAWITNHSDQAVFYGGSPTILRQEETAWRFVGCALGAIRPQGPTVLGCDFTAFEDTVLDPGAVGGDCCGHALPITWPDRSDPNHLDIVPGHYAAVFPIWRSEQELGKVPSVGVVAFFDIIP